MAAPVLTLRQLNRATLARQLLLEREAVSVPDAVERLAGLQAQEPKHPFVGLWTRVDGFGREDLHAALDAHDVVRATWIRGTLHLVTAGDYAQQRAALVPMLTAGLRVLGDRADGLDADATVKAARRLLKPGPRTFDELRGLLQEEFPKVNDRALGYATRLLVPLVMVPTDDRWAFPRVSSFTLAGPWLGTKLATGDHTEELVLRYLAAFGPATATDAQKWSGLPKLGPALEKLRPQLTTFADERGRELFDLPDAPRPDPDTDAPVRFLPEFDNLLLAHDDRTRIVADEHRTTIVTKNLRVRATFLVDGFAAGTWTVKRTTKKATLTLSPFVRLTKKAQSALAAEGKRLLRFAEEDAAALDVVFD